MQETNREKNELYSHINFKENDDGLVVENAQKGGRGTIGRGERSDPDTFRKWQQFALDQISMDYVVIDLPEHCKPCRLSSLLEGRPV